MDHRLHRRLHPLTDRPRNPFRNEADAFRVLVMFVLAGAAVIAAAALIDPVVGIALAVVFCAIGCWRAWGLWQDWGERDPGTQRRGAIDRPSAGLDDQPGDSAER